VGVVVGCTGLLVVVVCGAVVDDSVGVDVVVVGGACVVVVVGCGEEDVVVSLTVVVVVVGGGVVGDDVGGGVEVGELGSEDGLDGGGLMTTSGVTEGGARLIKPCWTSSTGMVSTGTVRHKTTCIQSQTGRRMREK